ncbi:MAG: carbohydrate ABC transporter permease [Spirochaetaceae bacterium]|jgi:raffinose/stachyose/melibiose transport system permease protein|nr:carbohydrate ABC transporter permease [Spirochaetaceae bacterium]
MNNPQKNYFLQKRLGTGAGLLVLIICGIITLSPLWILLINSFKGNAAIVDNPLSTPANWDFQYITSAASQLGYIKAILWTFCITVFSITLIVLISSLAAWILARAKTKISSFVFMAFVAAMLIPFQAIMYPLIQFFDGLGLKNIPGLILMYGGFGLSMSVFLYHGFVKLVPVGVEEAALIDGCNPLQLFFLVAMPLLKPITVTVVITNAMWIWNDYLLPFLVIGNSENKTLVLALYFARVQAGQYGNPWQLIFPAVFITIVPIIIVFLALQKHIVKGINAGAIKA